MPVYAWLLGGLGAAVFVGLLRAAIWRSFRAPRLAEDEGPSAHGLPGGAARLPTVRERHLHAWWVPPEIGRRDALCLIHGWGANASVMLPLVEALRRRDGRGVLVLSARCHGASDGDTFASLPRFAEDLSAGVDWLRERPEVDPEAVTVAGHSVGAGAALLCAARRDDLRGVVALSAFAHPRLVMRRYLAEIKVPWCPAGWLVSRYVERIIGHRFDAIAPMTTVARVGVPAVLLHGDADRVVPVAEARLIRRRGGARLVVLPGVDHLGTDAVEEIAEALAAALPDTSGAGSVSAEKSETILPRRGVSVLTE